MSTVRTVFSLLKETFDEWNRDKAPRLAAALAYYTAFSIAPLLIIVIAVVGLVFGQEAASGQIVTQLKTEIGPEAAEVIETIIANSANQSAGIIATILGVVTIIFGAVGFFSQLEDALNTVWSVEAKSAGGVSGIVEMIKSRVLSFTLVLGIGFLLLVSLVISAVLSSLNGFIEGLLPQVQFITQLINFVISFGVVTLLFAVIYKVLPNAVIAWRDVWVGAAITALLFTIGKFLLGLYLANSSVGSTYGAAGSFVVLLLWVYYSAQILLFGAEFTQVYARRYGSRIVAEDHVPEAETSTRQLPATGSASDQETSPDIVIVRPPVEVVPVDDLGTMVNGRPQERTLSLATTDESQLPSPRFSVLLVALAIYNTIIAGIVTAVFSLRGTRQN